MPKIVMFWDEEDIFGNLTPDIRIEEANPAIEVPTNACGFRLGKEGEDWWGTWHFYEAGKKSKPFEHEGLIYASSFTGKPSPSAISARGPVRGCAGSNGAYEFVVGFRGLNH